jgi:putative ABC transport system permease protein
MRLTSLKLAVRNLLLHKLRSSLTMLGTILGVSSVIAMLAIGEGSKREAVEQIRQLGATNVIIRSVKPKAAAGDENSEDEGSSRSTHVLEYGLFHKDFEILRATLPTIRRIVPIAVVRKNIVRGARRLRYGRVLGVTPEYLEVKNLDLSRGRFITPPDLVNTANVVILGDGAAGLLFSYEDPIGKSVLIGDSAYRVVGILRSQASGSATPGAVGQQDFNNDIYIPLTAVRRRLGEIQSVTQGGDKNFERNELSEITLTTWTEDQVSQTAAMARVILERSHGERKDFELKVPLELLRQAEREKDLWNLVLGSIAGISLLVGGIGIMNIMLATVTERTREIGVRRALGAKRRDITIQFLIETIALSASGGIVGVLLGVAVPLIVTEFSGIETALIWWSAPLAFGISVGIGIIFGIYPARRAALMDPIEALRHE